MALPFENAAFDAAVMPLVIFFVPEPAIGVSEMVRVVRSGGLVAAYAWDILGGGFPYDALWTEMRKLGVEVPLPPRPEAAGMDAMRDLWAGAGLENIETREIIVERTFADFDDYWTTIQGGPSVGKGLATMSPENLSTLKQRMQAKLQTDAAGRITCSGRANAAKGWVRNTI